LHNINIEIEQGKKIAIIGRTGSGKSTFIQSLYRLVEAEGESAYFINGRNTESMSSEELRGQFCCIPQNPFVFKDTIRANIDPLNQYSEEQIN
jgi:ATP-binding cassette, subfamily C (CFTR/MRP), member 4